MITVALPTLEIASPLTEHAIGICEQRGWQVRHATLDECGDLLRTNMVDIALTSPYGYGKGVASVDYRIVKGPCLALEDYTNCYGIDFPAHSKGLALAYSPEPTSFPTIIGRLTLAEKFDIGLELVSSADHADCVIGPVAAGKPPAMDLGEEWFDIVESPLPIALWVMRVDSEASDVEAFVHECANQQLLHANVSELIPLDADHMPREGKILYRWSDEVEEGLTAALHTMFYHQLLPEIPAIKVLGRD
ncbi:MAG: hypothetical protein FJ211_01755 [Ignavibacteria bacterium]|nr:hypothetical protein [Ignavibacteria bacterium]